MKNILRQNGGSYTRKLYKVSLGADKKISVNPIERLSAVNSPKSFNDFYNAYTSDTNGTNDTNMVVAIGLDDAKTPPEIVVPPLSAEVDNDDMKNENNENNDNIGVYVTKKSEGAQPVTIQSLSSNNSNGSGSSNSSSNSNSNSTTTEILNDSNNNNYTTTEISTNNNATITETLTPEKITEIINFAKDNTTLIASANNYINKLSAPNPNLDINKELHKYDKIVQNNDNDVEDIKKWKNQLINANENYLSAFDVVNKINFNEIDTDNKDVKNASLNYFGYTDEVREAAANVLNIITKPGYDINKFNQAKEKYDIAIKEFNDAKTKYENANDNFENSPPRTGGKRTTTARRTHKKRRTMRRRRHQHRR